MKKKINRKKGPVISKKVVHDGITFASGLERHMYKLLKENNIECGYEENTYELIPSFTFENDCYERQSNGKGDLINRGNKKVLNLKYTPDFEGEDFIIETKGRANDSFPLRWKIFKLYLKTHKDYRVLYKPQTQAECQKVVDLILEKRKMRNT